MFRFQLAQHKATWRLLGFQMVDRNPAVTRIHAHLEGEQSVSLPACATQAERPQITNRTHSSLMDYFARPSYECFDDLTILDYYEQ